MTRRDRLHSRVGNGPVRGSHQGSRTLTEGEAGIRLA